MARTKSEVEQFISDYEDLNVSPSETVSYSMREVNNTSHELYNGQHTIPKEDNGWKNIMTRKMWVVYRTLIQGSDIDMKNFNVRSTNGVKFKMAAFLRMLFISHLSRTFFGEFLDKVMSEVVWFGTSLVKRFDGTVDTVDLRNYITQPEIQDPQERKHLELCYYSYDDVQAKQEEWAENWEHIEEVWEDMQKENQSQFKILEFWTWESKDGKAHKVCKKYLDNTITEQHKYNSVDDWEPYIELETFTTPYKRRRKSKAMRDKLGEYEEMFPYEQFDYYKIPGRWQGMGCGELLAGIQYVYDQMFNTTRKNWAKASMGITVHNAVMGEQGITELTQDFLTNLTTGDVVTLAPGEALSQLPVDTRIQEFVLFEEKLYELMRQIMGVTSQGTGEEMPASTSATQASINQQVANTVYDFTRERIQHGIKRLFNNGYKEDVVQEMDEQEMIAIVGDARQLQELDNHLIDVAIRDWVVKTHKQTGKLPTVEFIQEQALKIRDELKEMGNTRFPQMKKQLLKDMEWIVEFDVTQEAYDAQARVQALMALKADPMTSKSKAKIEDEILVMQGLNPTDYEPSSEEVRERQQMEQMMLMKQMAEQQGEEMNQQQMTEAPSPLTA